MDVTNTMDSFNKDGFKIVRGGKVITLTSSEMYQVQSFYDALSGRHSLMCYIDNHDFTDEELEKVEELLDDKLVCEGIANDMDEEVYKDCIDDLEEEIVKRYIDEALGKEENEDE